MKKIRTAFSLISVCLITSFFSGCLEENFIPDPADPRLPKYTESGNQVAGALIDNEPWKTNFYIDYDGPTNRCFYFTNYLDGDSVKLNLDGEISDGQNKGVLISFDVVIRQFNLNTVKDIKNKLDDTIIELDGITNYAYMYQRCYGKCFKVSGGTGIVHFKNVKSLECNTPDENGEQYCNATISGVFNFEFPSEGIKVESGRFDFRINEGYIDQK